MLFDRLRTVHLTFLFGKKMKVKSPTLSLLFCPVCTGEERYFYLLYVICYISSNKIVPSGRQNTKHKTGKSSSFVLLILLPTRNYLRWPQITSNFILLSWIELYFLVFFSTRFYSFFIAFYRMFNYFHMSSPIKFIFMLIFLSFLIRWAF